MKNPRLALAAAFVAIGFLLMVAGILIYLLASVDPGGVPLPRGSVQSTPADLALPATLFVIGAILILVTPILGWHNTGSRQNPETIHTGDRATVKNRAVIDRQDRPVPQPETHPDPQSLRYLVEFEFGNGDDYQFLTDPETFQACTKTTQGRITFSGQTLLSFKPYKNPAPSRHQKP